MNKYKQTDLMKPLQNGFGKLPPQNLQIEEAIIGMLLLMKNAINETDKIINPDIFYKEENKIICNAILELYKENKPIDILTVTQALRKTGQLETIGGTAYLSDLTGGIGGSANIEYYVRIVTEKYIQRELIRVADELNSLAYSDESDVFELLENSEKKILDIHKSLEGSTIKTTRELLTKAFEEMEHIAKLTRDKKLRGVPSGFTQLDRITFGWLKQDLILIAGRPGMGKTTFALQLARNAAYLFNFKVMFFSLEMSANQLMNKLIGMESEIEMDRILTGNIQDYEYQKLHKKTNIFNNEGIFIDDTPALNLFDLRSKLRRMKQKHNIELAIIDYLQLMTVSDSRIKNRVDEITKISGGLKSIAKELNIPIMALSQMSRESEKGSRRPQLYHLRDSGSLEQDADRVIFIFRPDYYEKDTGHDGQAEIIISKNRHGQTNSVWLKFQPEYSKFAEIDRIYGDIQNEEMY